MNDPEAEILRNAPLLTPAQQRMYFNPRFRRQLNGQLITVEITPTMIPAIEDLELGKCNQPPQLTKRSLIYKKKPPTKCRKIPKGGNFFCGHHLAFPKRYHLPLTYAEAQEMLKSRINSSQNIQFDYTCCFVNKDDVQCSLEGIYYDTMDLETRYCHKHTFITRDIFNEYPEEDSDLLEKWFKLEDEIKVADPEKLPELIAQKRNLARQLNIGVDLGSERSSDFQTISQGIFPMQINSIN